MYQVSGQNSLPHEVNVMRGCVSFQIKVQILAFYAEVCTVHYGKTRIESIPRSSVGLYGLARYICTKDIIDFRYKFDTITLILC